MEKDLVSIIITYYKKENISKKLLIQFLGKLIKILR